MNGKKYFFHSSKIYEVEKNGISNVNSLRLLFPNGPITVNAAFTNENSNIIGLFHLNNIYVFSFNKANEKYILKSGFPKKITEFKVAGAIQWIDGNQILFEVI